MPLPRLVSHLPVFVSVAPAAIVFATSTIIDLRKKENVSLETHLARAGAAGALPTGLILLWGAVDAEIIPKFSGLNLPIAAAGLAMFWMCAKGCFKR